eukprot:1190173-Rhodomonas_salina.4
MAYALRYGDRVWWYATYGTELAGTGGGGGGGERERRGERKGGGEGEGERESHQGERGDDQRTQDRNVQVR